MAGSVTVYTPDKTWKVDVSSFKTSLIFYNAIGTSVDVHHYEEVGGNIWGGAHMDWVSKPATAISIENTYSGGVVAAEVGMQRAAQQNTSSMTLQIWAVGFSLSWDATADTGGPSDPNLPGGAPSFQIQSVIGNVSVSLPGQGEPLGAQTKAP